MTLTLNDTFGIIAYMQLVTPSEVAIAVRMLMAIWITIFQVSFFIIFYFLIGSTIGGWMELMGESSSRVRAGTL